MARKAYDVVATIGEYTDRNGEKKKRTINIGSIFENEKGQLSMKLDSIPVGPGWSGWANFYEPRERDAPPAQQARPQAQAAPARQYPPASAVDVGEGEEIPF
jgi:hypothetical protein